MKLRNKKTGEIKEVIVGGYPVSGRTEMWDCSEMDSNEVTGYRSLGIFTSLAELNEDWEDYEEPKPQVLYYIDRDGKIVPYKNTQYPSRMFNTKLNREIGNYFETKEEAEKAVEKLKAWKRLKDKGLTFCGWKITEDGCSVDIETTLDAEVVRAKQKYITDDLNLIFGEEA